ncbi:hypothetical protein [Pseudobacillus badius]|nr:hypothetical protein [Bacillus badius]GLY11431.1 hypothetical protein Bbad01_26470 [Bacillus badius]
MNRSLMYAFLLNMWMMKRVDEAFIEAQVTRDFITQEEANMIVATPQNA